MLLAIDSSTQMVGLALYDGAQVFGETLWRTQNHHTVELAPAIHDLMGRCGIAAQDLECVAVALGPGSFTSLRIGLAVAKGMALALHIPVVGIPTLDFLAVAQPASDLPMIASLQSGRGRLAVQPYRWEKDGWVMSGERSITHIEELAQSIETPTIVCGEFSGSERQILNRKRKMVHLAGPALSTRRPSYLAELAWKRWTAGKVDDPISLAPIYLSAIDAAAAAA